MDNAAATLATFSDFRLVKGRKVAQLIFECPIEKADEALLALGGLPRSDLERWCGIALVEKPLILPTKPERHFTDMPRSQQAGMLCQDQKFWDYVGARDANHAASIVRMACGIKSRSELDTLSEPAKIWDQTASNYRNTLGLRIG